MAEKFAADAIRRKWLHYTKDGGWEVNFGLSDFVVFVSGSVLGVHFPDILELLRSFL